jgi:hypothetical protein
VSLSAQVSRACDSFDVPTAVHVLLHVSIHITFVFSKEWIDEKSADLSIGSLVSSCAMVVDMSRVHRP